MELLRIGAGWCDCGQTSVGMHHFMFFHVSSKAAKPTLYIISACPIAWPIESKMPGAGSASGQALEWSLCFCVL